MQRSKLSPARAIEIATRVCRALDYIHTAGVVHRDLKPENIMGDGEGRTKLIDFGIASRPGSRRPTFGDMSQVMGTPDYISPEQVAGKPGDARGEYLRARNHALRDADRTNALSRFESVRGNE
jgi:eukaryotic-like serine/threonine-protein kinase